jgi:hypothetical protein
MCFTPETKPHGPSLGSPCVLNVQPPPPYADYLHDQPYHAVDIQENLEDKGLSANAPFMVSPDAQGSYLDTWLKPPCYNAAITSVVPQRVLSPSYWSIAST